MTANPSNISNSSPTPPVALLTPAQASALEAALAMPDRPDLSSCDPEFDLAAYEARQYAIDQALRDILGVPVGQWVQIHHVPTWLLAADARLRAGGNASVAVAEGNADGALPVSAAERAALVYCADKIAAMQFTTDELQRHGAALRALLARCVVAPEPTP